MSTNDTRPSTEPTSPSPAAAPQGADVDVDAPVELRLGVLPDTVGDALDPNERPASLQDLQALAEQLDTAEYGDEPEVLDVTDPGAAEPTWDEDAWEEADGVDAATEAEATGPHQARRWLLAAGVALGLGATGWWVLRQRDDGGSAAQFVPDALRPSAEARERMRDLALRLSPGR